MERRILISIIAVLALMLSLKKCDSDTISFEKDLVSKRTYDSLRLVIEKDEEAISSKQTIISLLEKKQVSLENDKKSLLKKYNQVKSSGRISIVDNPCDTAISLAAYDEVTNYCDSMNTVNDSIQEAMSNQLAEKKSIIALQDSIKSALRKTIDFKDEDFKACGLNNDILKKENKKIKRRNILTTFVAVAVSSTFGYLYLKK